MRATMLWALFLAPAAADLPIHCIHDQVFGEWKISFGKLSHKRNMCGYESPDTNKQHFSDYDYNLNAINTHTVTISSPENLLLEGESTSSAGNKWSMVYDEGLYFKVGKKEAFAYFDYQPKSDGELGDDAHSYITDCKQTRIGWYHEKDDSGNLQYGCFKASLTSSGDGSNEEGSFTSEKSDTLEPDQPLMVSPTSYVSVKSELVDPDSPFAYNLSFIHEVNSDPSSTWKAHPHPHLHHKITKRQAYSMMGRSRFSKPSHGWDRRTYHHRYKHQHRQPKDHGGVSLLEKGSDSLPKSFDWREKIDDVAVIDQGSCGSCYSVSTTAMATVRLKLAHSDMSSTSLLGETDKSKHHSKSKSMLTFKDSDILSPQDVLNCSPENQGCEGGYPFLVGWHSVREGIARNTEVRYIASDVSYSCKKKVRQKAVSFGYIGGHYGAANEDLMKKDLYKYGPVTVGIDAPSSLFSYSSGIFKCKQTRHEGSNLQDLKPWEATNHAVLLYGWGELNGKPYWLLKNSWGSYWGENGFFKIPRDNTDACAVMSMPVGIYY